MRMNLRRRMIIGGGAALGLAGLGIGTTAWLEGRAPRPDRAAALVDPHNPVLGNPQGRVTVVEFFDYQCPYCKRDHGALMDMVTQAGDIRLVMRDWPIFGAVSVLASQLVLGAASLGEYARAHAALMATPGRLNEAQIHRLLRDAGIDPDAALTAYRAERDKWDALLTRSDFQATSMGLRGTPAFVIGSQTYFGALGEAGLRTAIDAARRAG